MFLESSLNSLYQSTLFAFPNCTKRQNSTDTIVIRNLQWTPFVGMKTMFIKGVAQNEDREYNTIVLLRKVNYQGDGVQILASDGLPYSFDKLSLENTDVSVRCNCKDFFWRANYANSLDKSLYGSVRKKYESQGGPAANPTNAPMLCKHLMKTMKALKESGIFIEI